MNQNQTGTKQTVVSNSPWVGQQDPLKIGFDMAQTQLDTPQEFFPNSTVVPFAPQTEAALQGVESRALNNNSLGLSEGMNNATVAGQFLDAGNPYFSGMMDRISNQVRPRIDSQFGGAGRYGSAGHQEAMARALADAGSAIAFQNYGQERGRMQDAIQQSPTHYLAGFSPFEQMQKVGQTREGLAGAQLQEQIKRHDFAQQEERNRLRDFMSIIGGGQYGGDQVRAEPIYAQSPLSTGLGSAASIASIAGNLFGEGGFFG